MRETNTIHHASATWIGVALLLLQSLVHAESDTLERIEWKKAPIRLELPVGQEQRIEFPASVKVGVPASVQGLLRTQSVNGTVYLLAHAPFGSNRLMVRELDRGRIYLFDVTAAEEGGASHPIQVYVTGDSGATEDHATGGNDTDKGQPDYIQLTRFAAQQLYAPSRLLKDQPGIVRVPVSRDLVDLLHGAAIEATPLVAWRTNGLYITAVKLINRTNQAQTLDPRDLRGAWLTATFQHHRLLPKGDEADTTAVYLISARPFEVSR
ncbi:MAG: TIGR03749 family integrating conjugative element protein [Candidatus Thiodiazotropha lotti]|nr:TIGR03749 family integrating conjugative element protein [Candidatus Thiodiazotropha lotti]